MTTKVLTGTYVSGYLLQSPITTLRITASGFVEGSGVKTAADAPTAYSIFNAGAIVSDIGGPGIYLSGGGKVTNGRRPGAGVAPGGYISGSDGVLIENAPGTVTNFGRIAGSASYTYGAGVYLAAGGKITNGADQDTTATIAGWHGVEVMGGAGTLRNLGTVQGLSKSAVYFGDGGRVVNGSATDTGALISGGSHGVSLGGAIGTVDNFGTITGPSEGVILIAGGEVRNGSASDTQAQIGGGLVGVYARYGVVRNFATITADPQNGVAGVISYDGRVVNGSAADTAALIDGANGVNIYGAFGTLKNFGTVAGYSTGVYLLAAGSVINGSASDTQATIESASGVAIRNESYAATVANFGVIVSAATYAGSAAIEGGAFAITNGGARDTSALIEGYAGIRLASPAAAVTNFGTIMATGSGNYSSANVGIYLSDGGTVTNGDPNDPRALIAGYNGVLISRGAGTVTNFGTIEGNLAGAGGAPSVYFRSTSSNSDSLIAEAGSVFIGVADVGQGSVDVVSVAARFAGGLVTSGAVGGAGTLSLSGGFSRIETGAVLSVAGVAVLGRATVVEADESLNYDGTWRQTAGTLSVAVGQTTTFTGEGCLFAGTIAGAGGVAFFGGSDTFSGTTLAAAEMSISGANVTLTGRIANGGTVEAATRSLTIGAGGARLVGGVWALSDGFANRVVGLSAGDTLTNISATLSGAGMLGAGQMRLINRAAGVIDGDGRNALVIDTGANRIGNFGLIEAVGAGGVTIQSAVRNGGRLEAAGGTLTANGAVSGPGTGVIAGGALIFNAAFNEDVSFIASSGMLQLARSQSYRATITGFSRTGGTSLDLRDIAFLGSTEATFRGTTTSGVLTVTDGTHTARIKLAGDYTDSTFVTASDGQGGVRIVDFAATPDLARSAVSSAPSPHSFVAAMASLAGSGGQAIQAREPWSAHPPLLVNPRGVAA